jgi:hypothetical protein
MSTIGSFVKEPGIVYLPTTNTILRGQMVGFTPGAGTGAAGGDGNTIVPPSAGTGKVYGIALSDSDITTPGLNYVPVGIKGGFTAAMSPIAGQVFHQGDIVYQDSTDFSRVTAVVGTNAVVGWAVSSKPDSLGNIEVAFFLF